jgi:anti-anti-sigma regulatory factor
MAVNFRITLHQNSDNLHLRLDGDFDGSSAQELLNALEERCSFSSRAFIHTSGIRRVDPFGLSVFHSNLKGLKQGRKCRPLHFTGDHACELAPEESKFNISP